VVTEIHNKIITVQDVNTNSLSGKKRLDACFGRHHSEDAMVILTEGVEESTSVI
jgi:hypothetical protein